MHSLFFWKTWLREYRYLWYFTAVLFLFSFLFLWFSYWQGVDGVIDWEKIQQQKIVETTVHTYRLGPFTLDIPAENYILFEYFHGSNIRPNTTASYIFLTVLSICAVILITVTTAVERFWYFIATALVILFILSLRFEVLGLFGISGEIIPGAILAIYLIPSFYFSRLRPSTPFLTRFFIFTLITVALVVIIRFFSVVEVPFYHLSLTAYTSGIILSILFIITVAHEVLASLVSVVNQGTSKNLRHLSIISFIYLVNLFITCLHEMDVIQWDFIYINLYLLLSISAILGIWQFRHREPVYGNILPFYPFAGYFYLALGAICLITTAHLLANANDPAVRIIRDAIIFSHTGFGLIFLTYLFSNYVLMLARNIPVYKVLYNPTRMPYFTYRFAGLIVMLAFVFISNWRGYVYDGISGFYNMAGDMYNLMGNRAYAESFYEQGRIQGFQNHRSNYALGNLKASHFNMEAAHFNYQLANDKRPTVYSLTNGANMYLWENDLFGAIKNYRRGLTTIPGSPVLSNNLGLAYAKIHNIDSAVEFLNVARETALTRETAETNFFGMAAQDLLPLNADSVLKVFDTHSPATVSNALLLSTLFNQPLNTQVDPLQQKTLNLYWATLLNNYVIKQAKLLDTAFLDQAYSIADDSVNADYSESLKASLAFAFYHQGNVSKALQILGELAYISQSNQGKYNYIMGLWALEQNNPELAASYFSYADTYDYKQARLYHAIALTEAHAIPEALAAWDTVAAGSDASGEKEMAQQLKRILTIPAAEIPALSDGDKYQFCRYRLGLSDSLMFDRIVNTMTNPNYKAQALLDFSSRYFEADEIVSAIRTLNKIQGLQLSDENLYAEIQFLELRMLAYRNELRTLASQINKGVTFDRSRTLDKSLFTAMISESSGDTATARKNYDIVATYNPYFEEGVIEAAGFFKRRNENSMKAYTVLSEAIQINANSIRLLKAYMMEARRKGFDEYAASAQQRLEALQDRSRQEATGSGQRLNIE